MPREFGISFKKGRKKCKSNVCRCGCVSQSCRTVPYRWKKKNRNEKVCVCSVELVRDGGGR